jgi:multidrug efflux system outer membrane protein
MDSPTPRVNILKTWPTHNKHVIYQNTKNPICMAWWKQYHDPILDQLISEGIKCNNDLQIAIAHIEAAQGELKQIELNWIPTLGGNLGYSSFPYLGYPGVLVTAVPTYTINIFGQIKEQQRAQHRLQATKAMKDGVKLAIIAQIARSYFSYLAQIEQLQLLKRIEKELTAIVAINRAMYQGALYTNIDLVSVEKELNLIKGEETNIKRNMVRSQNAIHYLLNKNPEPLLVTHKFADINPHTAIFGSLPLNVLENRPDMRASISELKASNARVGIAISNFLPTIQLSAARGDIATVPNGTTLGMPIYFNQALLQQPMITLSSFGQLDQFKALNKAAYYQYIDTVRKILRDVDNRLAEHEFYSQRLENTINAQRNIKTDYQLHKGLFKEGIISYLNLLEEQVKLNQLNILVNQHKLDQTLAVVNLYQELAVGYGCS